MTERCPWCGDDPLYVAYHDKEWGVPEYGSRALFEGFMLEAFQAGLSWITILRKRETFRAAFEGFDPEKIARYTEADTLRLLGDAGIVRHRGKIEAMTLNARGFLAMEESGSFSDFLWGFVDGKPLQNAPATMQDVPGKTPAAEAMSKALKKQGFKFCGPTICYAAMQANGLVNDHLITCPRHSEVAALA